MLEVLLITLGGALIVFLIVASMQPDEFQTERSAVMKAPASVIFDQVNDLHKWEAWSPWAKMEPEAETVFEGPKAGVNAAMKWKGKKTGVGKMTVIESRPGELVKFRLEFFKPFKGTNTALFTFTPEGNETRVSWSMEGKAGFISKAFGLLVNCKKMMNQQFDSGLASIKEIVEAR